MKILVLGLALLLSACGFQLRGSYDLPFRSLHIALPETGELHAQLKRSIEGATRAKVVGNPKEAEALMTVLGDAPAKNILSLNAAGRVREFQLVRTFRFRVADAAGREYIPPSEIVVKRDITFNDAAVLAKESEETLLWRDMQDDLIQQLLRRLAAARLKTE